MSNLLIGGRGMTSNWATTNSPGAVLTISQGSDPDGGSIAARLTEGTGTSFWNTNQDISIITGSPYTQTIKAHPGSSGTRNISLVMGNWGWSNTAYAIFNPSNGALLASGTTGAASLNGTPTSLALSGGWYEFWFSATFPSSDSSSKIHCQYSLMNGNASSNNWYTGDGASNLLLYDPTLLAGLSPIEGLTINSHTANYTTVGSDSGTVIEMNSSSALTLTCNQPIGFNCLVVQKGTGQVTIAAASPNTGIVSQNAKVATSGQYALVSLYVDNNNKLQLGGNLA